MGISRRIKTDVLVIGSGLSGIKASKELAGLNKQVLLVTKTRLASGSSFYPLKASLGTQVTKNEEDKTVFLKDIEELSRGMHRQDLAEVYVNEIPERVQEYSDIGVISKKLKGERKACFANHPRDIYLLSDWDQIRENIRGIFSDYDNLKLIEKTIVVSLVKKNGRIAGAILLDESSEFVLVDCGAVILATGGFGSIYKHNLNPTDVDGSGHILALEAGARLVNMEFIQFIPGITSPRYKTLFGEHTLTYARDIVNEDGESLLDAYLPESVSKQECLEIRSTHGPFTHSLESKYVDIAMMKNILGSNNEKGYKIIYDEKIYENKEEFYTVYLDWLKEKNVHLTKDEIRIAPFAHASNGGVFIDTHGSTGIDGLYVIGELSSNIEGANRLGGNSTGACMVFGKRAAMHCAAYISSISSTELTLAEGNMHLKKMLSVDENLRTTSEHSTKEMIESIKEIMWYYGNVVRSEEGLRTALYKIKELESNFNFNEVVQQQHSRKMAFKARNFVKLSQILLQAMLVRRESRGAHFREDFPKESHDFDKRLFISQGKEQSVILEFLND